MEKKDLKRGAFVTFEGFEGSGKSTQIKLLADFLRRNNYPLLLLREPGSTKISEAIRNILLDKKNNRLCEKTELLLYLAARAQIVQEKISPALGAGRIVLSDRFHDATIAYQGFGLRLDNRLIDSLGDFVTGGVWPDLTILLDIDVKKGLSRAGRNKDRIEQRSLAYHRRVRQGYLKIAALNPRRVKVIKVKALQKTQGQIRKIVMEFLCRLKK